MSIPRINQHIKRVYSDSEFEKYRIVHDQLFESDFDRMVKQIEKSKKRELTIHHLAL